MSENIQKYALAEWPIFLFHVGIEWARLEDIFGVA